MIVGVPLVNGVPWLYAPCSLAWPTDIHPGRRCAHDGHVVEEAFWHIPGRSIQARIRAGVLAFSWYACVCTTRPSHATSASGTRPRRIFWLCRVIGPSSYGGVMLGA